MVGQIECLQQCPILEPTEDNCGSKRIPCANSVDNRNQNPRLFNDFIARHCQATLAAPGNTHEFQFVVSVQQAFGKANFIR